MHARNHYGDRGNTDAGRIREQDEDRYGTNPVMVRMRLGDEYVGVSCCEPRSFACWISCVDCIGSVFRSVHSILRGAVHHSFLSHVSRSLSLRLWFLLVVPHQYLLIRYGSIRSCGVAVRCGYAVLVLVSQGGVCTILVLRIQHYVSGRGRVETGISA